MAGVSGSIDDSSLNIENDEQMESLMTKSDSPLHEKSDDRRTSTASPLPYGVSSHSDTSKNGHQSPTRTAELMIAGSMPKNRRRPGPSDGQRVTMTGTVTRGNGVGQPVEVRLSLTERELYRISSQEAKSKEDVKLGCGREYGPHIVLWSLLCMPVVIVLSLCVSFYHGSMAWYNFIIYFSEEKSFFHKVAICPVIILSFPLTVTLSAFVISLVASVMQISWSWQRWLLEVHDWEKGFYGWFCGKVGLPNCSPYQVVVLDSNIQ